MESKLIPLSAGFEPASFFHSKLSSKPDAKRMQKPTVNVMVKAARQAGSLILRYIHRLDGLKIVEKERQDFVSEVDEQAEAEIIRELKRAHPDYAVLAEESGAKGRSRFTWVIDPIDGTSNYLRGFPHYCISIALVEGEVVQHGVIFDPLRNELFTASRGGGAMLNDRRMRVSQRETLEGALLATGFPPRERARLPAQLDCIREIMTEAEDIRRTGSAALDLAYVAAGRVDGYFEAGVKPWDIAAGLLLVREAGGTVCDYHGRNEGLLEMSGAGTRQIVAGNIKLADVLQKRIVSSGYAAAFDSSAFD
jgi:myo-inositol-1(or 4)-monophosphatase